MTSAIWVYAIGFLAQLFFSARIVIQWVMTERAHRIVSPSIFWKLSIAGSWLLCLYGFLRDDFAIVLGQVLTYYIYIWNLRAKGSWKQFHPIARIILLVTPPVLVCCFLGNLSSWLAQAFNSPQIPLPLLCLGVVGQVVFILRFYYQWQYSFHHHESLLPIGFWVISLVGSSLIVLYGAVRLDPVLILGQSFGLVAYVRNIMIGARANKVPK